MSSKVMTRVLVLHGYSQNATILSKRLGALRKESKDIDFVFVTAPHVLLPAEMIGPPSRFDSQGPGDGGQTAEQMQSDPNTSLRTWWKANKGRTEAVGLTDSIIYLKNIMKETTFDGVFGFSQGAAFAALLAAMLERPHLYPPFLVDGQPPHPPFKFCVAISGFKLLDPFCIPFFSPSYSTPTLHVLGKTDVVVVEERSRQLIEVSSNARVEEHEGGHFVPSKGSWRKFLVNYMLDPTGSVPSPGSSSRLEEDASAEVSGTNTPRL
ncbi:FSH1-domain-containing protein [Pholiota conissans]|uniref:FSH1-domain-containing protein n=1 Tax=Pholiota conissans TaxID=109636 RepID=A0A9P6CQZ8_9AGAR|nr:FSH1-domain-containing protein [Pholiota conissans]